MSRNKSTVYSLQFKDRIKKTTHCLLHTINFQKGFSLVEVVIILVISGTVGAVLVSIFSQNNSLFYTQTTRVNQGLSLNEASNQIQEALRTAAGIAASNTVGSPQYTSSATTLVLSLTSIDSSGNIIEGKSDFLIITKDTQKSYLLRKIVFVDPASSRKAENTILATKLSNLKFNYYNSSGSPVSPTTASKVNYIINLSEKASYGNEAASASSDVNLRNN